MAKDPAFLFYPQDFIMGTLHFTNEQVGIYVKLLCFQHQHGGSIDPETFHAFVRENEVIKRKFESDKDGYFNVRLHKEMVKRNKKSSNLSANAMLRWEKEKQKQCKSNAIASDLQMPTEDEDEDVNEREDVVVIKGGYRGEITEIIQDLNNLLKTSYKANSTKTRQSIQARLKEGFTVEDFKTVHRKMIRAWGADTKMVKYLRPETLYSPKFEGYLNMKEPTTKLTEAGTKAYLVAQEWLKKGEGNDKK